MFDLIICFTDNTKKIIHNVSNYLWGEVEEAVTVEINNASRMFFNMSQVKFIGGERRYRNSYGRWRKREYI